MTSSSICTVVIFCRRSILIAITARLFVPRVISNVLAHSKLPILSILNLFNFFNATSVLYKSQHSFWYNSNPPPLCPRNFQEPFASQYTTIHRPNPPRGLSHSYFAFSIAETAIIPSTGPLTPCPPLQDCNYFLEGLFEPHRPLCVRRYSHRDYFASNIPRTATSLPVSRAARYYFGDRRRGSLAVSP